MTEKKDDLSVEEVIENYTKLVTSICRRFYLVGGTFDDLYQEGMIGLLEAYRHYDRSRGDYKSDIFRSYAATSIKRHIIDAIKASNTKRNSILNNASPILQMNGEHCEFEISELGISVDPEEIFISKEKRDEMLEKALKGLSSFETEVLWLYLDGLKTSEIAVKLGKEPRSITNTIQRIKLKIKE